MTFPELIKAYLYPAAFLWLGACVGSFLNVVIHRLPRQQSVSNPKRSYCPSCGKTIPWWCNLPLISWPLLRGKCRDCGSKISIRYWLVEWLTALLFLALALRFPLPESAAYAIMISFFVAGAFIDWEHMIIPHRITIGGALCGILASTLVPTLMEENTALRGFLFSLSSAGLGIGVVWMVVEFGKLAFGKVRLTFDKPTPWKISQNSPDEPPVLEVEGETFSWLDMFQRPRHDKLLLDITEMRYNGKTSKTKGVLTVFYDRILPPQEAGQPGEPISLESIESLSGLGNSITIPREAMGFGDVLLMGSIGAFLGWKAVLFSLVAGSVTGSLFGIIPKIFGRDIFGKPMPFGPHLILGAVIWLFTGPALLDWYLSFVFPEE